MFYRCVDGVSPSLRRSDLNAGAEHDEPNVFDDSVARRSGNSDGVRTIFRAQIYRRNLKQSRDEMRLRLSKVVNDTKDQMKLVEGYTNRGRSAMKGIFGSDSAQYAQVGGTRKSERKSRSSKKPRTPKP